ncbi:MAG: hypothetical protein R3A48_16270 [Polyangiales bacterium]
MRLREVLPLAFVLGGCNASYAPPLRSTHYGLPGRLSSGQGELSVAAAIPHPHGSASLSIPVSDRVRVESTYDLSDTWHLGSAGLRGTVPLDPRWSLDFEGGVGAGVGGERCGNDDESGHTCEAGAADGLHASDRFAYGAYAGAGVGVRPWRALGFFARGRAQVSAATNTPVTAWGSGVLGLELATGPLRTHLSGGVAVYSNRAETQSGGLIELGLSVPFSLTGR